jgi:hypothetical protein
LHLASSPLANVGCASADEVDNRSVDGCPTGVHAQADLCDELLSKKSTGTSADMLDIDTAVVLSSCVQSVSGAKEPALIGVSNMSKSHVADVAQGAAVLPIIEEVEMQTGIPGDHHAGGNVSLRKSEEVDPKSHSIPNVGEAAPDAVPANTEEKQNECLSTEQGTVCSDGYLGDRSASYQDLCMPAESSFQDLCTPPADIGEDL